MSKIKIRCSLCGESFKSAHAKQLICPKCEDKARRERAAKSRGAPTAMTPPPPVPPRPAPPKVAPVSSPSSPPRQHWLDQERDVTVAPPESREATRLPRLDGPERRALPGQPALPQGSRPAEKLPSSPVGTAGQPSQETHPDHRGASPPSAGHSPSGTLKGRPARKSEKGSPGKEEKQAKTAPPPKREPRPPTPAFVPTADQIAAIEQRYLELAQPHEHDGIRTQIAQELGIPKSSVKRVVATLRDRLHLPSWWEMAGYHGSPADLERIRQSYIGFLPLPTVGIHKQIAQALDLAPGTVYQGIKAIRTELHLPPYNPPEAHGLSAPTPSPDAAHAP